MRSRSRESGLSLVELILVLGMLGGASVGAQELTQSIPMTILTPSTGTQTIESCGFAPSQVAVDIVGVKRFESAEQSASAVIGATSGVFRINHTLGTTPDFVSWVGVCKTNCAPKFHVGDEVDLMTTYNADSVANVISDATQLSMIFYGDPSRGFWVFYDTSNHVEIDKNNSDWKIKVYAYSFK